MGGEEGLLFTLCDFYLSSAARGGEGGSRQFFITYFLGYAQRVTECFLFFSSIWEKFLLFCAWPAVWHGG
jgi:hypothetical protein